jgi:hypothetical protein
MKMSFELNAKEKEVLSAFPEVKGGETTGAYLTLEELARRAFPKKGAKPKTKGNSWVRNSIRKLLKLGLVKGKGAKSGAYARTRVTLADVADRRREADEEREERRQQRKVAKSEGSAAQVV